MTEKNESLGARIARLRKDMGLTQEELAEKLGITAQAISKWENDLSAPDISALPILAGIFGITVDELLGRKTEATAVRMREEGKNTDDLLFKIRIRSADGNKVNINLPMSLLVLLIRSGISLSDVVQGSGEKKEMLNGIDLEALIRMVDAGMIGKLVEIEADDDTTIEIFVE